MDGFYQTNSCNCPRRNNGRFITRKSRSLNASKTSLCALLCHFFTFYILLAEQKRIKRKEYQNSSDFAADVELVFSNALTFNQDETLIWQDAMALRVTFIRNIHLSIPELFSLVYRSISVNSCRTYHHLTLSQNIADHPIRSKFGLPRLLNR